MRHIAIEGCIGAGKTTLARALASHWQADLLEEAVDLHPFLTKFYSNPSKYALETELNFLLIHYHQLAHYQGDLLISDFTLGKDLIFARLNLQGRDLECFETLYHNLAARLATSPEVIFLNVAPEVCLSRIQDRQRSAEHQITPSYLSDLQHAYHLGKPSLGKRTTQIDVDANASPEQVLGSALAVLEECFN